MPPPLTRDLQPRRRVAAMLSALIVGVATVAIFNLVVNPYGAWPLSLIDPAFRSSDWRTARVAAPYRARLEHPHTLLIGNSRMLEAIPLPAGEHDGIANLAIAGATMDEIAALAGLALKSGAPRRVVWAVDFSQFNAHYRGFLDAATARRVRGDLWFRTRESVFSVAALQASWTTVGRAAKGASRLPIEERRPVPWSAEAIDAELEHAHDTSLPPLDALTRSQIAGWFDVYHRYRLSPECVALFAQTVHAIQAAGIELFAFLPPLSLYELEIIREAGAWPDFLQWKRAVAAITPVWDFSGYAAPASAYPQLFDAPFFCHFRAPLGHLILRHLLGQSCAACGAIAAQIAAAAPRIDTTMIGAYLDAQDSARQRFVATGSPYTERVRAVATQVLASALPANSLLRHPRESGDPSGKRTPLIRMGSRLRGNDGEGSDSNWQGKPLASAPNK